MIINVTHLVKEDMSHVTVVLLPNTTYYMLRQVSERLASEAEPPLVIGCLPGWVISHAPHAKVVSTDDQSDLLVLDTKPRLVITDLITHDDPIYKKIMRAAESINAEVWCIMYDAVVRMEVLLAANTVWFPKGSQWIGRVPPSIQSCFYDADALYLKRDVASRSGSEGEAALVGLTHEHEARQLPIRLANKGNRVILVAGSY